MNGQTPWEALAQDFGDVVDLGRLVHVAVRLLVAAALGGVLGYQRESVGKDAGMRTYMLVTVGAAFFVIVPQLVRCGLILSETGCRVRKISSPPGFKTRYAS